MTRISEKNRVPLCHGRSHRPSEVHTSRPFQGGIQALSRRKSLFGYQMARLSMARLPLLALEIGATRHKSVVGDLRWIRVVHALVHLDK